MKFLKIIIIIFKSFKDKFVYYGRNGGIHGLNHLFSEDAFFLVRLFWLLILITSGFFLYLLIIPILELLDHEVNFTIETRYLDWNTNFPAITLCEDPSFAVKHAHKKLVASDIFKKRLASISYGHAKYLADLLYGKGTCNHNYCESCGKTIPCDIPWRELIDLVHPKCEELLTDCAYNGVSFPCCEKFLPVDSEFGTCFAFNTLQNKNASVYNLHKVNRTSGPGVLSFHVPPNSLVSIHSVEELSTNTMSDKFKFKIDKNYEISFIVTDMENDLLLYNEYVEDRKCRFLDEVPDEPFYEYPVYGHKVCELAEDTEHSYAHCGCISPVRDLIFKDYFCKNYSGLSCLTELTVKRTKYGSKDDNDHDKSKYCLPSCVESEIVVVHVSPHIVPKKDASGLLVVMRMIDLPHHRFRRNVLRTDLDIVVSIGGVVGLFFGASILSLVELFYLFFRKSV